MAVTELIVTSVASLAATLVGGSITYFTQRSIAKQQFEKEHRAENEKLRREKLEFYGELLILEDQYQISNSDLSWVLDVESYRENIRGTLYNKIYLLNSQMINCLREIDRIIREVEQKPAYISSEFRPATTEYKKLFQLIETEIDKLHNI